jgi:hypothetical protein
MTPTRAESSARPGPWWRLRLSDGLRADLRVTLPAWLAARALVVVAYILALGVAHRWLNGGTTPQLREGLMAWDGTFYRDIATVGYRNLPVEALRFFPLYPLGARGLGWALFGQIDVALLVIANGASLALAVVTRRLVLLEKQDEALAERAVWFTALFPSAFVLVWAYAEGLFLLATVATFLAVRSRRYELAAACALVAALTRPLGVLLVVPIAIEALRERRVTDAPGWAARSAAVLAPVAGLALYLAWVQRNFGNGRLPFTVQSDLRGDVLDPVSRMVRGVGDLFGPERFGDGLHIPFAVAFVVLLVIVFKRWPVSYGVFAALVLLAALSADNLNSLERYALNAFPLVFAVAGITAASRAERLALAVGAGGLVSLCALAWLGVYVP